MFAPIAIVGRSCLLPGAHSPDVLWRLLYERRAAMSACPASRWRASRERMLAGGICASDVGGFVEGFEAVWTPADYAIDPDLLADLDPLVHWLLHTARGALLDARLGASRLRIGAIVGNLAYPTEALVDLAQSTFVPDAPTRSRHPLNRYSAGYPVHLLCRALGLDAGGYAIDAACASSLYAVHLACRWLHTGRADVMLAGAVNRVEGLLIHAGFTALRALSPTGQSRPFHQHADGLVPAEGAAFLVLRRLHDAEAAGDRILGVIRGIGLSNDGRGPGVLAPSEEGQLRAMRAAYTQSGLNPSDISLVECHATGTQVGDAVELRSMSRLFGEVDGLPIGSLKSNFGHPITVAGAAAIIKVLEALRHGVRPATISAWPLTDVLSGTRFRVLQSEESWECIDHQPRRAAINSFGFGGNNAHVLIEEYRPGMRHSVPAVSWRPRAAVVAVAARLADGETTDDFVSDWMTGTSRVRRLGDGRTAARAREVRVPSSGVIFPPHDLARTLAQQNLLLALAIEAAAMTPTPSPERTAIFVGMACDGEVTRTVLRAALPDVLSASQLDGRSLARLEESMDAGFDAARVVGCMPNMPANRLNRQLGFGGPSFTVAAEELSGVRAVDIAVDALASGAIDAALVGAADFCVEPVHLQGTDQLPRHEQTPGDGGCVLVLKREADALADGDRIHAVLEMSESGTATLDGSDFGTRLRSCVGHVHAASGLLEIAMAVTALDRGAIPDPVEGTSVPVLPGVEPHRIRLDIEALGDQRTSLTVIESPQSGGRVGPRFSAGTYHLLTYAATSVEALRAALESGHTNDTVDAPACRLAIVATDDEYAERVNQARSFLQHVAAHEHARPLPPEGIFFQPTSLGGPIAFVFTGAAAGYSRMGRELLLAVPDLVRRVNARCDDLDRYAGWIYRTTVSDGPDDFERLCGSSFLCQIHAEFSRQVLGLVPDAAIGLSSGETNALFALGAWDGMHLLLRDCEASGLYTTVLGGRADAIRESWAAQGIAGDQWAAYSVSAPVADVEEAIGDAHGVHITIVNSPVDVVIGGEADACHRVVQRIGLYRSVRLRTSFAVHCPEIAPAAHLWKQLHTRPTIQPAGVRFYSNARGGAYSVTTESVADALTRQALGRIDFPRTIRQAWADGLRVFIEHGPRSQCAQSIRRILGDGAYVAVALDSASRSAARQALYAAAELWAAGVPVDLGRLRDALRRDSPSPSETANALVLRAHPPAPLRLAGDEPLVMTPAPTLASITEPVRMPLTTACQEVTPTACDCQAVSPFRDVVAMHAQITRAHEAHLQGLVRLDDEYQWMQSRLATLASVRDESPTIEGAPTRVMPRSFSRQQIELHATGRISDVFGSAFAEQDGYQRRVRMPAPPLLLVDRVTSLQGEPGGLEVGRITTETDVRPDAWYVHHGRMAAGLMIEAGQADLMLISWLGIDSVNRGRRVYRLLGCDLRFSDGLPRPGETLRYDIHVDGHASHGDLRMFSFHYDCTSDGATRLRVRNGQAGFFTDEELAAAEGVLWSPESGPPTPASRARADMPRHCSDRRSFNREHVSALVEGHAWECFGKGFEYSLTHSRAPRSPAGRLQLLQHVPVFEPAGGPWGRGYLRAEWTIRSDDWFFQGHFTHDPCMPGTLMFEGCLQAMAFYLTALGFTLDHDGWRFEPVPDEEYSLCCRGQVLPTSQLLVYEVFVDEIVSEPVPTIRADVLCTVDGLKAFHCSRLGLRLVPDWPLEQQQPGPSAGMPFDYASLLACALGRPSNAFGPAFARFDGPIKVPRLPAPPYHFLSRVTRVENTASPVGSLAEVEYDIPPDAWYFASNGHPVMPFSILTEVLLQPCGWLASHAGTWQTVTEDIFFRNLEGRGVIHSEVGPHTGVLRTTVRLTSLSQVGVTSITTFAITCHAGDALVFEGEAVFGHFPARALESQAGLSVTDDERRWLVLPAPAIIELDPFAGPPLPRDRLRLIDRVSGYWPDGGRAGLGQLRAEMDVDPSQWFFKAHFFRDPVQPGSLGMEAILQTLRIYMSSADRYSRIRSPRFEAIAVGTPVSWTYRGQVLPRNARVTILLEVLETEPTVATACASLWVDGAKIYSIPGVSLRIVESSATEDEVDDMLDPARDRWLRDHCPTYTVPVLPMMSVVDRLAAAAQRAMPERRVIEVRDVVLNGWITFATGARRLKTCAVRRTAGEVDVTLQVWRDAPNPAMSRYDIMATACVETACAYPPPPPRQTPLADGVEVPAPYEAGELFHGPSFHFLEDFIRGRSGSSFLIDSTRGRVPRGFLNQGLLDGITHGIPNEALWVWSERIAPSQVGYPSRVLRLGLYADPPADGRSWCEVRFAGFHRDEDRFPQFRVQLVHENVVWADMDVVYVLFPKGPLGHLSGPRRRAFLQEKIHTAGAGLGRSTSEETSLAGDDLHQSDWLPGTLEHAYALVTPDRLREIAIKEHVSRFAEVHPSTVLVADDWNSARCARFPLTIFPVRTTHVGDRLTVRDNGRPQTDSRIIRSFWRRTSGVAESLIEDLYVSLSERFVRRVELLDASRFAAIRGAPALFLANHQVAVESILFAVVVSALADVPVKVLAKVEHRQSWIGQLIELTRSYPGMSGHDPILFFDRGDPAALIDLLARFRTSLREAPASLLVHVDGTRARSCRTPVSRVSSLFIELALDADLPIVPVRFVGGLPGADVPEPLEFPWGGGRQDVRLGPAIAASSLRERSMVDRTALVIDAINALAPEGDMSPGRQGSIESVGRVLIDALRGARQPSPMTRAFLARLDGHGTWPEADDRDRWLERLRAWLEGLKY